jgi:hypothetical protein
MNETQITPSTTATVADFSLPNAIVGLGLCAKTLPVTISKLTTKAAAVLGLENNRLKPIADKLVILEWLSAKVALGLNANDIIKGKTTPDNAPPAPATVSILDSIDTTDLLMAKIAASDAMAIEENAPAPQTLFENVDVDETTADLFAVDTATPSNEIAEYKQTEFFEPIDAQTLEELAVEINYLNEQVFYHESQAVIFAAQTGEKLLLAKAQCKHGEFGAWLLANCTVSQSYANSFMKIAVEMPHLLLSNSHSSVNIGLKQAIELLSATDEVKTEVIARVENGDKVTVSEIRQLKKQSAKVENEPVDLVASLETIEQSPPTAPSIIDNTLPIEPPTELKTVEVGALLVDNTAIEEVHYCLETIENHLRTADFSDKWRVELAEYKRIGAIFESLVSGSTIIDV